MAIIYGLKVNLSVAMVAMVNQTAVRMLNPHDDHLRTLSVGGLNVSDREECESDAHNTTGGVSSVS